MPRSVHNAVSDVLSELGMNNTVDATIEQDVQNPGRWLVTFTSRPGSLTVSMLEVEVLENNGNPAACVLSSVNVLRHKLTLIMDLLMERLWDARSSQSSEQSPPGAE
jgi:hypothetical protein